MKKTDNVLLPNGGESSEEVANSCSNDSFMNNKTKNLLPASDSNLKSKSKEIVK